MFLNLIKKELSFTKPIQMLTDITIKLVPQVQSVTTDHVVLEIDPPSGRALLGEYPDCSVVINNDVCE